MDYVDVPAPASALIVQAAFSGEFVDKVIAAESSGNPQARPCDPRTGKLLSSAYGAGQFVESTWLAMVKKHRPDLASRSDEEILDLRGDFALSREMTIKFTEQNRTHLIKKGLDPTYAALYLAHFAGATGATKLLKAHRDTPVEKILSPEAVEANQFLRGHTPATLYAWARKKMSIEPAPGASKAAVTVSDKVTPHGQITGCGGDKPAKGDAKALPKEPESKTPEGGTIAAVAPEAEVVAASGPETEAAPAQDSRVGRAVRFIVGGIVRFATRT